MIIFDIIEYFQRFSTIDKIALFVLLCIFLRLLGYFLDYSTVNKRRRNTPCYFDEGISESMFKSIVDICAKDIDRLVNYSVDGPVVYGEVISQSEKNTWHFSIDFNDYGHIDGIYWLSSDNHQSEIPSNLANRIGHLISYGIDNQGIKDSGKHNRTIGSKSIRRRAKRDKRRIIWTPILICIELAFLICGSQYIWHLYRGYTKSIPVGISSNNLIGLNYLDAEKALSEKGFFNIQLVSRGNIDCELNNTQYCTCEVRINGVSSFVESDLFPYDSTIQIIYYEFDGVYPPVSAHMTYEMTYYELEEAFKNAGFENVTMEGVQDVNLLNPWSYGEVGEIKIDNRMDFTTSTPFRKDSEVVIVYHIY